MAGGTPINATPGPSNDASTGRRPTKAKRLVRTLKSAAESLYRSASNRMSGTLVTKVDSETLQPCRCSHSTMGGFNGWMPEHAPKQKTRQTSNRKRQSLAQTIRRAEGQRGRPLSSAEQEFVVNHWKIKDKLMSVPTKTIANGGLGEKKGQGHAHEACDQSPLMTIVSPRMYVGE
mmetsp:Transcript_5796/g.11104  ORF Transcript_5796/g.11104 Transcript_5796/m.11104 type:complete len:175 (+) Transcript_5796:88-612(+)